MLISHWRLVQAVSLLTAALLAALSPDSAAHWQPQWITMTLVFWGIARPGQAGFGMAWAFGLMADLMSGGWVGIHVISYSIIVFLCTRWNSLLRLSGAMQKTVMLGILLIFHLGYLQLASILIDSVNPGLSHWASLVTSLLIWPLLYPLLTRLANRPDPA